MTVLDSRLCGSVICFTSRTLWALRLGSTLVVHRKFATSYAKLCLWLESKASYAMVLTQWAERINNIRTLP